MSAAFEKNKFKSDVDQTRVSHNIPPVFDQGSRVLILGSFPSIKSRESSFFYANPQNRFWRVLSSLYDEPLPETIEDKIRLLRANHIALWDVIADCVIRGSSDASISDAKPNELSEIFKVADIERIFANGSTAKRLYDRFMLPIWGIEAIRLPSTSPANAAYSTTRLIDEWQEIKRSN